PNLYVLASSPVVDAQGAPLRSTATYYQAPSGAEVVAIGSIGWSDGLGATGFADPRVARITRNLLDHFAGVGHEGHADPSGAPWTSPGTAENIVGAWAASVTTVVAGDPFVAPAGVAVAP